MQVFAEKTYEATLEGKLDLWKTVIRRPETPDTLCCNEEECGWWCEEAQKCGIADIQHNLSY